MTAPSSIDPSRFLHEHLASASPDLLREMMTTFVNAMMSAEVDAICGAPYGLSSPERSHGVTLQVRFRPTTMPSAIAEVMRSVLISSDTILHLPEPTVQVVSLDGNAVALDEQLQKVAETDTAHQLALNLYRKYATMFRTALGRT